MAAFTARPGCGGCGGCGRGQCTAAAAEWHRPPPPPPPSAAADAAAGASTVTMKSEPTHSYPASEGGRQHGSRHAQTSQPRQWPGLRARVTKVVGLSVVLQVHPWAGLWRRMTGSCTYRTEADAEPGSALLTQSSGRHMDAMCVIRNSGQLV